MRVGLHRYRHAEPDPAPVRAAEGDESEAVSENHVIDPRALDTLVGIVAEAPEDGQVLDASFLHEARDRILGTILLTARTKATVGKDTEEMLRQRLTFAEAIEQFDLIPRTASSGFAMSCGRSSLPCPSMAPRVRTSSRLKPASRRERAGRSDRGPDRGGCKLPRAAIARDDPIVALVLLN